MADTVRKTYAKLKKKSAKQIGIAISGGITVFTIAFGLFVYTRIKIHKNSKKPIGYIKTDFKNIQKFTDKPRNLVKLKFNPGKTQIPKSIDYIIIGSGISGLSCAALLARCGRKVLVLEQNGKLGGCMHIFSRKYKWDTGIHYVGNNKGKYIKKLKPITEDPIEFVQQGNEENGYLYDKYIYGNYGNEITFDCKPGQYIEELLRLFPDNKTQIEQFVKLTKEAQIVSMLVFIQKMVPTWFGDILWYIGNKLYPHIWGKSVAEVVGPVFGKTSLLAMNVSGCIGDLGGTRADNLFFLMCEIINHYKSGGYYFKHGPAYLTQSIIKVIEKHGGRCVGLAPVQEILFQGKRAVGVKVIKDGKEYVFKCNEGVISSAGFRNTFMKLAPVKTLPTSQYNKNRIERALSMLTHSAQHFTVFIGFNKSAKELKLPSYNRWIMRFTDEDIKENNFDYDTMIENFHKDPLNAPLFGFIAFPASKDPGFSDVRSNCTIVTEIPLYHFEKWKEQRKPDTKDQEYKDLKKKIGQRLMEELLFKYHPETRECIDKIYYGTPLTSSYYLGSFNGESYGLFHGKNRYFDKDINRLLKPNPLSDIKNLYTTGQDNISGGWSSALQSGILTAEHILGYHTIPCIFSGRSLIRDLNKMDAQRELKRKMNT